MKEKKDYERLKVVVVESVIDCLISSANDNDVEDKDWGGGFYGIFDVK